jgi:hypothetical protein
MGVLFYRLCSDPPTMHRTDEAITIGGSKADDAEKHRCNESEHGTAERTHAQSVTLVATADS